MDQIIDLVYTIIQALIFIRIIISWVMPQARENEFVKFINNLTEPLLAPFRLVIPVGRMGGMDLSPLILLVVLNIVRNFLVKIL